MNIRVGDRIKLKSGNILIVTTLAQVDEILQKCNTDKIVRIDRPIYDEKVYYCGTTQELEY
jgi:hypothetical protein